MTSKTRKEGFKKSMRCPECNEKLHLKNKKYYCSEHGYIIPSKTYPKHASMHTTEKRPIGHKYRK